MLDDLNPFVYSHPLAAEDVIDREDETHELLKKAVGGHFVRLYAPRKYGKTSLLLKALGAGAKTEGLVPIHVDLYRAISLADIAVRFERAYSQQLKGAIRGKIDSFLKTTGIGLSLGAYGISARLQLDSKADPLPALHTLLALPLELEKHGGYRAFIVLDEFQDIEKIPGLDGLIRSHIQYHGSVASYVFAGSEPGLMKQLFENRDRPLYGSAVPMRLGRLDDGDIAAYVAERFRQSGREIGEALNPLVESADGHPKQAMLLAHLVWEEVAQGETATFADWEVAHEAALDELEAEFEAQWRGLDTSQQKTLRALVDGAGSPYRTDVLRRLGLTKDMVRKALPRLLAAAEIELVDRKYLIVDPLFAEWIGRPSLPRRSTVRSSDLGP